VAVFVNPRRPRKRPRNGAGCLESAPSPDFTGMHTSTPIVLGLLALVPLSACDHAEPPPAAPTVEIARAPSAVQVAAPEASAPAAPVVPKEPSVASLRDERRPSGRARGLLVADIQGLESLFGSIAKSSPDRPKLLRRLAEEYAELASVDEPQPAFQKSAALAHSYAMKFYQRLASEYPRWCITGNAADPALATGCTDEVLYYLGLEAERNRELDTARKTYLELIQTWPQSRYIPYAYFAFGELFFNDAASDPSKFPLAEQSYAKVIQYPPPGNGLFAFAHYRLAQVFAKKGDDARALSEFLKAAQHAKTYGDRGKLGVAARHEAVAVYARAGDPAQAGAFFGQLTSDPEELEALLQELATITGAH
jgi:TolA-binding protein